MVPLLMSSLGTFHLAVYLRALPLQLSLVERLSDASLDTFLLRGVGMEFLVFDPVSRHGVRVRHA
jgi:hypothetical protein